MRGRARPRAAAPAESSSDEEEAEVEQEPFSLPDGFQVAHKPAKVDESCQGRFVFLNWQLYGWQFGQVIEVLQSSVNPRLVKQGFNTRVQWADKSKGPCKLNLEFYAGSRNAPLDSWVFLEKK